MILQATHVTFLILPVATVVTTNTVLVQGHGLMESPPSRNHLCGMETQPHELFYGNGGATPECRPVFEADFTGGYQFMSVLTHGIGRMGGKSTHVCGFDSETWQGASTPWDIPMDWPTTPMTAGRNEIVWNIAWGPHFDDTEEFRYWITKPDFLFDPTQELTWDDFEDDPFCVLTSAYPDVIADNQQNRFFTFCDVPVRAGHHAIYGEWGRNEWTYERFHGCIDAQFGEDLTVVPSTTSSSTLATSIPIQTPTVEVTPPPPVLANCVVEILDDRSPWYAGFNIGFDSGSIVLDFSASGLALSEVTVDEGNFNPQVNEQTIILEAPDWVSSSVKGYLGFYGDEVAALATFAPPVCTNTPRMLRSV